MRLTEGLHIVDLILVLFKEDIVEFFSPPSTLALWKMGGSIPFSMRCSTVRITIILTMVQPTALEVGPIFLLHSGKKHAGILKIAAVINDNVTDLMKLFPAFCGGW